MDNNRAMIIEEFARVYDEVTDETRMICNCLNLAQGFKRNFSDEEILTFVSQLDFIDNLTHQHLKFKNKSKTNNAKLVPRNPVHFKEFFEMNPKTTPDPFSNFYLKEHARFNTVRDKIR